MLHVLQGVETTEKKREGPRRRGHRALRESSGAEPQNGGGMTTRSRENGYERQCNILHGGVVACGATYYVEIVIG